MSDGIEMKEDMNLITKLCKIRSSVEYLQKTESGNQGAKYVDPAVLLKKIREQMNDLNVNLSPAITDSSVEQIDSPTKNNPNNKGFFCKMTMTMTWACGTTGEDLVVPWFATANHLTDPAMAMGGALTYTERYFMLKYFQIPTAKDDPEYFNYKASEKITMEQVQILQEMVHRKGYDVEQTLIALASKHYNVNNIQFIKADQFQDAHDRIAKLEKKNNA